MHNQKRWLSSVAPRIITAKSSDWITVYIDPSFFGWTIELFEGFT